MKLKDALMHCPSEEGWFYKTIHNYSEIVMNDEEYDDLFWDALPLRVKERIINKVLNLEVELL